MFFFLPGQMTATCVYIHVFKGGGDREPAPEAEKRVRKINMLSLSFIFTFQLKRWPVSLWSPLHWDLLFVLHADINNEVLALFFYCRHYPEQFVRTGDSCQTPSQSTSRGVTQEAGERARARERGVPSQNDLSRV